MRCVFNLILFGGLVFHLFSSAGSDRCGGSSRARKNEICKTSATSSTFLGILNVLKICHQQQQQLTCAWDSFDAYPQPSPRQILVDTPPSSMALVLYQPTILSAFREETKTFSFAGRSVTIRQKWEELGVAAVVWDAVRYQLLFSLSNACWDLELLGQIAIVSSWRQVPVVLSMRLSLLTPCTRVTRCDWCHAHHVGGQLCLCVLTPRCLKCALHCKTHSILYA